MRTPLKTLALAALNRQLSILSILLIGIIGVQTFTSCGKGGGDVKLLESITADNGMQYKFEYDEQNRIVKIGGSYPTTITYNSDDLITVKVKTSDSDRDIKYVRKGNTITKSNSSGENDRIFTVNEDGYLVKQEIVMGEGAYEDVTYQYQNGNLTKLVDNTGRGETHSYDKYDDKKSPFSNSNTPKWLLQDLLYSYSNIIYANKNNVLSSNHDLEEGGGSVVLKYEYDSDGFPTKQYVEGGMTIDGATITRFTYRGKGENVPVEADK